MQVCPKMTKMDPNHFPSIWIWIFLESCLGQMDKIHVSFYLLWGAGGICVCCDTVSLDLQCSFVEIFRSHFTSQQITDKTKSVGYNTSWKLQILRVMLDIPSQYCICPIVLFYCVMFIVLLCKGLRSLLCSLSRHNSRDAIHLMYCVPADLTLQKIVLFSSLFILWSVRVPQSLAWILAGAGVLLIVRRTYVVSIVSHMSFNTYTECKLKESQLYRLPCRQDQARCS